MKKICTLMLCSAVLVLAPVYAQLREAQPEVRGIVKAIDAKMGSITIASGPGRDAPASEKTFTLAKNVEIVVGAGANRFGGAFRPGAIADLVPGMAVSVSLTGDQKTADSIAIEEPLLRGLLKRVDAKKKTITVATLTGGREPAMEEQTLPVADDAEIAIDDGRGKRFSIREGTLDDLAENAVVSVRLSLNKKQALGITAEGALVMGLIKAIDADKRSITLTTRPARGDDAGEEKSITVAKEAVVLIDDGKGRRLSIKDAKLADIPQGSNVMAKLSVDQNFVMFLKAEGPNLIGLLKGVDGDKLSITIAIPKSREEVEEKTLPVAKDARIILDANLAKLTDLKVGDNGPYVQLKMSLDQTTVQTVIARQPGNR